jgi:hypothetical protein
VQAVCPAWNKKQPIVAHLEHATMFKGQQWAIFDNSLHVHPNNSVVWWAQCDRSQAVCLIMSCCAVRQGVCGSKADWCGIQACRPRLTNLLCAAGQQQIQGLRQRGARRRAQRHAVQRACRRLGGSACAGHQCRQASCTVTLGVAPAEGCLGEPAVHSALNRLPQVALKCGCLTRQQRPTSAPG